MFVGGCTSNQGKFYDRFDRIVLLSAQSDVIVERLATRTNNPFGKQADELRRVLGDLALVEPILRAGATDEIVTTCPLEEVVADIVRLVEQ